MKNRMTDLRNHLFDVIERLKDPDHDAPMDIETAEAICLTAKHLLDSAEVEIKFRDKLGYVADPGDFLADRKPPLISPPTNEDA